MRWVDAHTHTKHDSKDARQSLDELLREADQKALMAVCLTEHYDKDSIDGRLRRGVTAVGAEPDPAEWAFNPERYLKRLSPIRTARQKGGQTRLLLGIEVNFAPYLSADYRRYLEPLPFDQIIYSAHFYEDRDIYWAKDLYRRGKEIFYPQWLTWQLELLEDPFQFQVFGHYDYVARYAPYEQKRLLYREFPDHLDAILKQLIRREAALEINTKAFYTSEPDPQSAGPETIDNYLDADLIRRYLDLGGELVTLSSDSHQAGCLALGFDLYAKRLYELGLRRLCYFVEKKPRFLHLD